MLVRWSLHAKHRFAERAAKLGIPYGEIELEIRKQKVKIKEGKNKFKTIFKIEDGLLTAVKIEKKDFIHVLTLWEANELEANLWKKK
ncbi:MAG: hypothetical protein ABIA76_05530 [Candidatus Diapherotrites archaeon]